MRCWKCGIQNPEDREICRRCGAALSRRNLDESDPTDIENYEEEFEEEYNETELEDDEY
jgi:uncharacterized membrane protein YvbJ